MPQKIKKGDLVEVIAGRNKGEKGRVMEVFKAEDKVRVEGIFIQKRHVRAGARQNMPSGGIIDKPGKIHISNVRLYSEKLEKSVRVGFKKNADGNLVRVARGRKGAETELD
jgi:large subunit ribosomal protein L24